MKAKKVDKKNNKESLIHEWAAITGTKIKNIRPQIDKYLDESKAKIPVE